MDKIIPIIQKDESGNIQSSLEYFLSFNFPKSIRILDIGCGQGSLVFNLYRLGYINISGIDIMVDLIKKGKDTYSEIANRLDYYSGERLPFPEETFDVVLAFDVIEHIPSLQGYLKEQVYRVLKKDAVFIFQTPNKIINIGWEIINHKSLTKWRIFHNSLQTRSSLQRILIGAGFSSFKLEKGNILTEHNINKVQKKIGFVHFPILVLLQKMPLVVYPNFWGSCRK
jgi:2-polyprenyl-3-methyl-5-hydroxy-6-metoxy-1,4-benzoquinol methylase